MSLLPFVAAVALNQTQAPDPHNLPIGRPGVSIVQPNQLLDLRSGKPATIAEVAAAADGVRFVYVGENHDQLAHHQMQADVIEALVKRGRDVVVGFEQFTRPYQSALNPWTLGWWSDEEFVQKADWKANWGMDYGLYKPIFDVTKRHKLPMVALNVPRDWVRRVSRTGWEALTPDEQKQVPPLDLTNKQHESVFNALMGGHPPAGMEGIYRGQVLWDTAMADSAIKYLANRVNTSKTVFVVVAGSGHVMYGQAINYRVWKRTGDAGITVTAISSNEPTKVANGLGDFVYCTTRVEK